MSAQIPKVTVCLWYNHDAEDAAKFHAQTFPGSSVGAVWRAPGDYPTKQERQRRGRRASMDARRSGGNEPGVEAEVDRGGGVFGAKAASRLARS